MRYVTPSHACAYAYIDSANNVRFRNNGVNQAPHKPVPRAARGESYVVCFLNMRDFFYLVRPEGCWDAEALRSVEISPNAPVGALQAARLPFVDWCAVDPVVRGERGEVDWVTALRDETIVRLYKSLRERMSMLDALDETARRFCCSRRSMWARLKRNKKALTKA